MIRLNLNEPVVPLELGNRIVGINEDGYTGALKAPVRCFGNHLSRKRKSLFRTDDECGGAAILKIRISRMGRQLMGYYYSLNAGSSPYTSLMER